MAWAVIPVLALAACSGGGEPAVGATFSPAMNAVPGIESPLPFEGLVDPDSRAVGSALQDGTSLVITLGHDACGLVVSGGEGQEAVTAALTDATTTGATSSDRIGEHVEVGVSPRSSTTADEWVLRCGTTGVEVCGSGFSEDAELIGLERDPETDCLVIAP